MTIGKKEVPESLPSGLMELRPFNCQPYFISMIMVGENRHVRLIHPSQDVHDIGGGPFADRFLRETCNGLETQTSEPKIQHGNKQIDESLFIGHLHSHPML